MQELGRRLCARQRTGSMAQAKIMSASVVYGKGAHAIFALSRTVETFQRLILINMRQFTRKKATTNQRESERIVNSNVHTNLNEDMIVAVAMAV